MITFYNGLEPSRCLYRERNQPMRNKIINPTPNGENKTSRSPATKVSKRVKGMIIPITPRTEQPKSLLIGVLGFDLSLFRG